MIRPTVAVVDLDAIAANVRALHGVLAERTPAPGIIAVVKAGAYGHGAARVGVALEAAGVAQLACADIEEGLELRRAGVSLPILVFGALSVSDLSGIFEAALTPTISTPSAATAIAAAAAARGVRVGCHLKIDTGMNRFGLRHDNLGRTLPPILASPHLHVQAVYTHFATAGDPESPAFEEQRRRFDAASAALGAMGLRDVPRHAANSAAMLRDARTWYDWVRPGLLLYGVVPPPLAAANLALGPALSLRSRIVAVKGVRPGEGAGYGHTWHSDGARTLAMVPAGYADGLDTRLAGRASVLVGGRRAPIVGSVCMDVITIDVTGMGVSPGDEVVLLGRQGDAEITARETAASIGAIPWEVLCRLGSRIERRYESQKYEDRS